MTNGSLRAAAALSVCVLALPACTDWAGYDMDKAAGAVPTFSTMRRSPVPDPYQMVREPASGTVPVTHPLGNVPAPYGQAELDQVAGTLSNPLQPSTLVLDRGRALYQRNCTVCHGATGDGRGPIIAPDKFPFAPALNTGAAVARSDGYIYAVLDVGRGLMPPYGSRMSHLDRWAVVTYVRQLQRGYETANPQAAPVAGATGTTAPAQPAAAQPAAAPDTTPGNP